MKNAPAELLDFLDQYQTYILAGHREPDGDCVGSIFALASFLERRGKKTILLSSGPFKRPEIKKYESLFRSSIDPDEMPEGTAVVVIDCSNIDRVGDAAKGLERFPCAIIDHHATNDSNHAFAYVDGNAPATTMLIQAIIEAKGETPTLDEANMLLFGLCTDTGFFRHLDDKSAQTFAYTARLVAAGANPKKTFAQMNSGKSFGSRILISRILGRMKPYYGGRLMISYETMEDTQEFGMEGRDSDNIYQLIQSITDVEAIVLVRQETETRCSVGFRSLDRIDVSKVASSFGGGGHRQASGLSIEGTIEPLIPRFVAAFQDQFIGIAP